LVNITSAATAADGCSYPSRAFTGCEHNMVYQQRHQIPIKQTSCTDPFRGRSKMDLQGKAGTGIKDPV